MLRIWGRASSSNSQKVFWCLAELGVDYERVDTGGKFGGLDAPQYLALNPNGRVPTLEDRGTGFVLWESNAIVRYLCARHGQGSLLPGTPERQALADMWMEWQQTTLRSAILPLFRTFMKRGNGAGDAAALEAARDGTIALFGLVDRHLAQHAYMAGDAFSMGDIPLGVWAYRYTLLVPDGPDFPSLARWRRLLEERPAYREHVMLPPE